MVCKKCGKDIPDNALFCGYCGGYVGQVCKVCGAGLKQGMQYCPECGTAIENNAEINEVEPGVPIKDKASGDGKCRLMLLIIIGVCIGLMFGGLFLVYIDNNLFVEHIVMFTAALIGIIYGTFRIWRSYRNSNKQIKIQDIVICVILVIFSIVYIY